MRLSLVEMVTLWVTLLFGLALASPISSALAAVSYEYATTTTTTVGFEVSSSPPSSTTTYSPRLTTVTWFEVITIALGVSSFEPSRAGASAVHYRVSDFLDDDIYFPVSPSLQCTQHNRIQLDGFEWPSQLAGTLDHHPVSSSVQCRHHIEIQLDAFEWPSHLAGTVDHPVSPSVQSRQHIVVQLDAFG
ncbi:hypothetical protein QBC39DRAFT_384702 [Podospora conica]|nr:hypothetical protein QBC39DRAFT_384702 [Schizothecium conicum]